jgi:hypothetical protein
MERRRARWVSLGVSTLAAAAIFAAVWPRLRRDEPGSVRFHEVPSPEVSSTAGAGPARRDGAGSPPEVPATFGAGTARHEGAGSDPEAPATSDARPARRDGAGSEDPVDPREWRHFLTEDEAHRCFGFRGDARLAYDPWVYFRDAGNLRDDFPNPQHEGRKWTWRTNSLGCREDRELDVPPREVRVLVAGDSHTCGLCNNDESFANVLEARLAGSRAGRSVEVLNAGLGGYSFHHYLGTLLRFRSFAPQVAVVTVFGGNDFAELCLLEAQFAGRPLPPMSPEQHARRKSALKLSGDALGQGLNALDTFRAWPEEEQVSVRTAVDLCDEMRRVAERNGTQLIVAFLPAPFDFHWEKLPQRAADARAALGFADADLEVNRRMGAAFLEGLRGRGIRTLDLRPLFEREPAPPYWRLDFHLDVRGHALVAEALEPLVASALAGR